MRRAASDDDLRVEKIIVVPPDGGWGWVVVVAAFLCILIMDGISNTFGLLIPIFQKEFNASVSQISLINSLFTGFYFIFAPVAGSLSNRFGFRPVIIAGSIISAFGLGISVLTDSVQSMFATYGLIGGIGFSMMYINVVLTVGFYFERWRALATGITVSASGVGTFSFAPLVEILLQKYTWRQIFIGYSGLVFSCSLVAICFRPLSPISLEDSDAGPGDKLRKTDKPGRSMHNARYPTAAEAVDINQLRGSKITLLPSRMTSYESFEIFKANSKDHSSRNSELKRRTTEFSQFQSIHDLAVGESGRKFRWKKIWRNCFSCWNLWCRLKHLKRCCRRKKSAGVRPMYRDDIFYEGSVVHLPAYERNSKMIKSSSAQQSATIKSSLLYHLSVSRLPTHRDLQEERDQKCHLFPESMTRALKTMFDFRVVKYPLFLFFTISTCFLAVGINVPTYFTYVRALELGVMSPSDASLILSAIGITNTVGRIVCGIIATLPKINVVILHFGFLFFGALLNICVVFLHSKESFFIYAALYGLVLAEQGSLRSVILVKLVGLENLTNAFGILLLFLGIFTAAGTPTAGLLPLINLELGKSLLGGKYLFRDRRQLTVSATVVIIIIIIIIIINNLGYMKEITGSYDAVFIFSSLFLLFAALFLIPIFVDKMQCRGIRGNRTNERTDAQNVRRQNPV